MKKWFSAVITVLALAVIVGTAAMPALAHGGGGGGGHGGGGHFGGYGAGGGGYRGGRGGGRLGGYGGYYGGIGVYGFDDPFWWDYPDYAYPYGYSPYAYPGTYSGSSGPPAQPGPTAQSFWYFCQSSNAYYPYVSSCPETWRRVPMTPPAQ